MTYTLKVAERSDIHIGRTEELLPSLLPDGRIIVITDTNIDRYQHPLLKDREYIMIGTGESIKTLHTVEMIYRRFVELGIDRECFVLGIGGGIVTDITGFVASTYMRGLRFGFVSTTLLGQVDASVGGKNGVNLDGYKNMVGTFNQPQFVICDPTLLGTLPEREFRSGLAEIVKAGIIADRSLFERLENNSFEALLSDHKLLGEVILAAIKVKAEIVGRDERESGERRKLNLVHTFAHAIEKLSSRMNHGEAVAVGTILAARIALRLGVLATSDAERIERMLSSLGFSLTPPIKLEQLVTAISKDKKSDGNALHFVLPTGIGSCEIRKMTIDQITQLCLAEKC